LDLPGIPQDKDCWQHLTVSTGTLNADKSHDANPTHSSKPLLHFTNIYIYHINFHPLPLKYIKPDKNIQVKKFQDFDANSDSPMISCNISSRVREPEEAEKIETTTGYQIFCLFLNFIYVFF